MDVSRRCRNRARKERKKPVRRRRYGPSRGMFFFRLGTLIGEGAHPVEILALAESGAIVRIGGSLEEEERLELEVNSHHRFEVRVEWSSD